MSCWQLSHFNVVPAVARSSLSVVRQCGHWKTMSCAVFADDSEGSVEFVCIPAEKKQRLYHPHRNVTACHFRVSLLVHSCAILSPLNTAPPHPLPTFATTPT